MLVGLIKTTQDNYAGECDECGESAVCGFTLSHLEARVDDWEAATVKLCAECKVQLTVKLMCLAVPKS